jgi:undecaprenol kinase
MPRKMLRSAGHAYRGLAYAIRTGRNIRIFIVVYILLLLLGFIINLKMLEWISVLLSGSVFMVSELLNTALERLADSVDDHCKKEHGSNCFTALKHTKDIAAGSSLVILIVTIVIIVVIYGQALLPEIMNFLQR